VVPPDYTHAYYRGRGAEILLLVDATDPILARAVKASANGLMERHNQRLQTFEVDALGGARRVSEDRASFGVEPELVRGKFLRFAALNLYNPELRTPIFVVPALLGVILTTTMILMTALALVRERERGSFEFLIATPVRRTELMAGKLLPFIGIGFIQIVIVVATGLVLFRVPMEGRLIDLGVASLVFIAANLTLGLVISSVTKSQFQATQLSFFFFLPSVLLSGFMFPFDAMPRPAQWLGEMLPLTHFIRASRGILLRGSSLFDQATEVAAMLLFCAVGFVAATKLFTKKLD
jgi:ABC-2 type transport system permease protein